LGREDEKGSRQDVRGVADGYLSFGHGLEKGRLHLGGCAVDFVGKHQIGEHRPLAHRKAHLCLLVDECPDEVGRQEVGSKLYALEAQSRQFGESFYRERLCKTGHSFEEHMTTGDEARKDAVDQVLLADNALAHLGAAGLDYRAAVFETRFNFLHFTSLRKIQYYFHCTRLRVH